MHLLFTWGCCCLHYSLVLCNEDSLPSEHDVFGLYYQNVCGISHSKTPLFIIMKEQVSMYVTIYFNSFFAYDICASNKAGIKKKERRDWDKWSDWLHISLLFLSMNNRRPSYCVIILYILNLNGYAHMDLNDSNVMYNNLQEKNPYKLIDVYCALVRNITGDNFSNCTLWIRKLEFKAYFFTILGFVCFSTLPQKYWKTYNLTVCFWNSVIWCRSFQYENALH